MNQPMMGSIDIAPVIVTQLLRETISTSWRIERGIPALTGVFRLIINHRRKEIYSRSRDNLQHPVHYSVKCTLLMFSLSMTSVFINTR